jgi:hypothetical protein
LINPCEDFIFPDKNKELYFVNHYKKCNKCDVTDNNDREICSIIDEAEIEYVEITDETDGYFDPPLEAYWALEKYEPIDAKNNPFIRIAYINNGHYAYNKCILVSWIE